MKKNDFDNDNPFNLTEEDYKGVIYTPSRQNDDFDNFNDFDNFDDFGNSNNPITKKSKKPPKKKKYPKNSQFKPLMALAIITGIVICISVFVIVYQSFSKPEPKKTTEETTEQILNLDDIEKNLSNNPNKDNSEEIEAIGVINEILPASKQILIYNISNNSETPYKLSGSTELKDKYGKPLTLAELNIGEIVDFVYKKDDEILSLEQSHSAWELHSVKNFDINIENKTFTKGTQIYNYAENVNVTYNTSPVPIESLDPMDILTIKGYDKTIYSIEVEKSHGIITLANKGHIKNGTIEVDNDIYKNISDVNELKVSDGKHKIVVRGENIEPFSEEVMLSASNPYTLDLSKIQVKSGVLLIKANTSDYILYINNNIETSREPLVLPYGAYTIRLEKDGYLGYSTQINLKKEQLTINAELKKEVKMGILTVTSNPAGAELYIDNNKTGETPYSTELTQGVHSITVKKSGYKDITISSIYINDRETIYNVDLQLSDTTTTAN